jgi:ABC-2 type transport system ATP-binding protein
VIEVRDLVKKYGDHLAVDHLSFTVEKGHIYGFLGPNGAGKSTTMNMITGYIGATEGHIMINGHDMMENPQEAKKCIGYLPEMPPLYMDMTPAEYLRFAAELKGIAKDKIAASVEEVMEATKIKDVSGRLMKNLSKGYKQRVGLAQALLGYPEIIILDEPTVGLDPAQIIEIRELIKSLGKKHTVILSSHILSEISAVCDDVLILSHGRLVACDTTDNIGKLMEDKMTLHLTVKGQEEAVRGIVEAVEGVESVEITESEEADCLDVVVQSHPQNDVREAVFYGLAAAKCPIYGMNLVKKSLEDVFIELTADGADESVDDGSAQMAPEENNDPEEVYDDDSDL